MKMLLIGILAFFVLLFGLVCAVLVPIAGTVASIAGGGSSPGDPSLGYAPGQSKIVDIAYAIMRGQPMPGWKGGRVPYVWGGGRGSKPGPSYGTCEGYSGRIHPCPATTTIGVDCAGFTRWVYSIAYGKDVLGAGWPRHVTNRIPNHDVQPGDLAIFEHGNEGHVGIYIGNDQMINAYMTGTFIQINRVSTHGDFIGFYRYPQPPPGGYGNGGTGANMTTEQIKAMIRQVFGPYANQALIVAECESSFNPKNINPKPVHGEHAMGVFQFMPSTWKTTSYRNRSPLDAQANILAAYELFKRDHYTWREWDCGRIHGFYP